ncbi:hypothetical protein ABBQ38_014698 [Trebouxia sp. C0009 RCD-2024]
MTTFVGQADKAAPPDHDQAAGVEQNTIEALLSKLRPDAFEQVLAGLVAVGHEMPDVSPLAQQVADKAVTGSGSLPIYADLCFLLDTALPGFEQPSQAANKRPLPPSGQWWMQAGEASASVGEALAESQPVHGEEEREEGTITLPTLDPQAAQRCAAVEQKICCRREGNLVAAQAKAVARSRMGVDCAPISWWLAKTWRASGRLTRLVQNPAQARAAAGGPHMPANQGNSYRTRSRFSEVHVRMCDAGTGQVPSNPSLGSDIQGGLYQLGPLLALLLGPLLVVQCQAHRHQAQAQPLDHGAA